MDKKADLTRIVTGESGTIGVLVIDKVLFCNTLEPPKRNNEKYISCIPTGVYVSRKWNSPIFGNTYLVCNVPGRTDIEFRIGNKVKDTKGCILLGKYSYTQFYILTLSSITFHSFMNIMEDDQNFLLTVKEAF